MWSPCSWASRCSSSSSPPAFADSTEPSAAASRLKPRLDFTHKRLHCPRAALERLHGEFENQMLHPGCLIGTETVRHRIHVPTQQVATGPGSVREDVGRDAFDKQGCPH